MVTMTLGNVCALWQKNLRRLMAFSSIAHSGYMLVGLSVALAMPSAGGVGATLFYVVVYAFAALGVFAALAYLNDGKHDVNGVSDVSGLARTRPAVAAVLAVCLFSLAGIPPLAGFWGKLSLFMGAIQIGMANRPGVSPWFLLLAVVGMLNAAVAAAYYLRVISAMYFSPPVTSPEPRGGIGTATAAVVCCLSLLTLGLQPGLALQSAELADPRLQQSRKILSPGFSSDASPGDRVLSMHRQHVSSEPDVSGI